MSKFIEDITAMKSPEDQRTVLERYGARRNAPWFWRLSDKFQRMYKEQNGIEAGIFDLNRYHHQ